jgi:proteasome lid subunit RPN8/RPN11
MRVFLAEDQSVAVDIEEAALEAMLAHSRSAGQRETGGVLVGIYSEWLDRAVVKSVTGPPRDSVGSPFSFLRGVRGLSALFARAWRRGEHYLGEWHFHPCASARPSRQDLRQMAAFASNPDYQVRRTVLVIIGGDPNHESTMSVHVVGQVGVTPLLPSSDH